MRTVLLVAFMTFVVQCSAKCYPPTDFLNGIFSPRKYSYSFKDRLFFKCFDGFKLSIKKSYISCGINGEWKFPFCEPVICINPRFILHRSMYHFRYIHLPGQSVTFTCDEGFFLSPPENNKLTCQSNGEWSASAPTCHKIYCYARMKNYYGSYSPSPPALGYDHGQTVTINCPDDRYHLPNIKSTVCVKGKWKDDIPDCVPYCKAPNNTALNQKKYSKVNYKEKEIINYKCKRGYYPLSNITYDSATCQQNYYSSSWSNKPFECYKHCYGPTKYQNGDFMPKKSFYEYNDTITFSCFDGFEFRSGVNTATCKKDGSWSFPHCFPKSK